jgi:hypothetical protein
VARRPAVAARPRAGRAGWAAAAALLRPGAPVVEVKRLVDGREQRFRCELVGATRSVAVLLYRLRRPRAGLPAPLLSYGFYWPRRPYLCYRFVRPADGVEVARRFDVVGRVELVATPAGGGPAELRFDDLVLDLWVRPGAGPRGTDELRWEDEDELREAIADGLLSPAYIARVERARATLTGQRSAASLRLPLLQEGGRAEW